MKLEFWAINAEGEDIRGIREVRSREQLISDLINEQLVPMNICEPSESQLKLEKFKEVRTKLDGHKPKQIPLPAEPIKPDPVDYSYLVFILILIFGLIAALFRHA